VAVEDAPCVGTMSQSLRNSCCARNLVHAPAPFDRNVSVGSRAGSGDDLCHGTRTCSFWYGAQLFLSGAFSVSVDGTGKRDFGTPLPTIKSVNFVAHTSHTNRALMGCSSAAVVYRLFDLAHAFEVFKELNAKRWSNASICTLQSPMHPFLEQKRNNCSPSCVNQASWMT